MLFRVSDGKRLASLGTLVNKDTSYVMANRRIEFLAADTCTISPYTVCHFGPMVTPFEVCQDGMWGKGLLEKAWSGMEVNDEVDVEPVACDGK